MRQIGDSAVGGQAKEKREGAFSSSSFLTKAVGRRIGSNTEWRKASQVGRAIGRVMGWWQNSREEVERIPSPGSPKEMCKLAKRGRMRSPS